MSRDHFSSLLELIEHHPIFRSKTNKQHPVIVQLAVTLFRLGIFGNGASILNIGREFGISDGGSIQKMSKRVITAILSLRDRFVQWPTPAERTTIAKHMSKESK